MIVQAQFSTLHISQKDKQRLNIGMDNKEIRWRRLLMLIEDFDSAAQLAELVGTNAAYLSQIKNKSNGRSIGSRLARRLEIATKKPQGWMDQPVTDIDIGKKAKAAEIHAMSKEQQEWLSLFDVMTNQQRAHFMAIGYDMAAKKQTKRQRSYIAERLRLGPSASDAVVGKYLKPAPK